MASQNQYTDDQAVKKTTPFIHVTIVMVEWIQLCEAAGKEVGASIACSVQNKTFIEIISDFAFLLPHNFSGG